ncbi:Crp/Fnr family transcriptional regulator [Chryseotalea sanaruensis]|uniref:Crp/Fnr family transcriptional regulator n=1 Tax=Chryseotalea sanaruensis TaxID=2482724 RepID=A0A401UCV3_9BACT|nr:Crp/Fnr family transcriptional regulator [Chryseotalea sanaruensis]GCC52728.1 Crp/Fnr family transcriptional regulator [Chryseotalea sanaruensis]
MFSGLHQLVSQFVDFNSSERVLFENAFTFRQIPKKFKLVSKGEISSELYFINKGLIRLYYTKGAEEITGFIFSENLFASSYDSFLRRAPGIQTLESLEECDLLVITYDKLEELYQTLPKVNVLIRKIAEQRFINTQQVLSSFLLESPEERYKRFEQQHKDLLQRVPQNIIASYLGITPVSLSRIRKRMHGT